MARYTNGTGIPLSVAVYLATDHYDYDPDAISVTSLLKPTRQLVLGPRVPAEDAVLDIVTLLKSRMGTSIHDGIEKAWGPNHYPKALASLGYPPEVISRVKVNPDPSTLQPQDIPVYMEQRVSKQVNGQKVTGKFDFVAEGKLEDFKSTSVYTFISSRKDDDHRMQGSLYRWLAPNIITQDYMAIQYIFTDWMAGRAAEPNYPSRPTEQRLIPLMSIDETEQFVKDKLAEVARYQNAPEETLPLCNDKELWRSEPQYKYYKNPEKTNRSTKNFDDKQEAYRRLAEDGNIGVVREVPGQVMACKYCRAFPICSQKDALIADGSLIL